MSARVFAASVASLFLAFQSAVAEPEPRHRWDFDSLGWHSQQAVDLGTDAVGKREMPGRIAVGHGSNGSSALVADGRKSCLHGFPLPYDAFTIDVSFRLSDPLDGVSRRVLWNYAWSGGESHRAIACLTGDGGVEVRLGALAARSGPLGISEDDMHALRVSVASNGMLSAYLDGREVLRQAEAPTLNALRPVAAAGSGYPLFLVGAAWNKERELDFKSFSGVLDDIAVYAAALGSPVKQTTSVDYSHVAIPKFKMSEGDKGVLLLDGNGRADTGAFCVLEHEEGAFGQMCKADERFLSAASRAGLSVDSNTISAAIDCPVPDGMSPVRSKDVWRGDRVEFFVRPSLSDTAFFLFCVNAAGHWEAHAFRAPGVRDMQWKTSAKVSVRETEKGFQVKVVVPLGELFKAAPAAGDAFGVNFVRHGPTCGGKSMWATTGSVFNLTSLPFGIVVSGGAGAYFARKAVAEKMRIAELFTDEQARAAARHVLDNVCAAVNEHGDNPKAFGALQRMFDELEQTFVQIALKAPTVLLYKPTDAWGQSPEPDVSTRPLRLLRVRSALNCRTIIPLALSNFTDDEFVGQLKFMDRKQGMARSDWYRPFITNGVARHFTIRRGLAIRDADGNRLFDPVMELPMQTVVQLAPHETAPVYCELNTHGMTPGRYYAMLMLKRATPGFPVLRVPVEVKVLHADLGTVDADRFGYSFADSTFSKTRHACPQYVRRLVERGYNMLLLFTVDWFPRLGSSGQWLRPDLGSVDRFADAALAAGLEKEKMKFVVYLAQDKTSMKRDWWVGLRDCDNRLIPFGSEKWREGIRFMVETFAEHVRARYGVGRDRIYWYPVDEPSGNIDDPALESSISRAYLTAKVIKSIGQENRTMTDPLPNFLASREIESAWPKLVSVYDAIELYRPHITAEKLALVNKCRPKEVWTYSIRGKQNPPSAFRLDHWQNMRDDFREIVAWWHLDQVSGGDGLDSTDGGKVITDYATIYVDFDHDTTMLSRRQLAADQGAEDARLIMFLLGRCGEDASKSAAVRGIVKTAADAGTMKAMDDARDRLLDLAEEVCADRQTGNPTSGSIE